MAGGHSDYTRGTMEVGAQSGTFSGFMSGTKYGSSILALVILMPTLVFGVNLNWLPALIATFVFGVILGTVLKFKSRWYVGLTSITIITAFIATLFSVFA